MCVVGAGSPIIATLGDPKASTCSISFALQWLGDEGGAIYGYRSFDAALAAVLDGTADYLLVPGDYPGAQALTRHSTLMLHDQASLTTPKIVLVDGGQNVDRTDRLYYHPALIKQAEALNDTVGGILEFIEVSSNPVACDRVGENPGSLGLTNIIAAKAYGVRMLGFMRPEVPMRVMIFELNPNPQTLMLDEWVRGAPPKRRARRRQ